ncbi:MAG: FAD-dependent oxidoreductase [Eubacteriales bacterium]|nr:FAD-dependent oxidoreductase [Eubacteriales bacterium]
MKNIWEDGRNVPVLDEVDVLVLGAGPAGVSAAICAAREGMRTMLIEQSGDVGGVATTGLMSHWTGNTKGGFYEEILQKTSELNDENSSMNGCPRQIINPESLKTHLLEMLVEAGIVLRLYSFASVPIVHDNIIKGVILESKAGRQAALAKIVIDSTGDGDIAARAGVPYFKGREEDGLMQPVTIMFKVAGVDTDRSVFPGSFEENPLIPAGPIQDVGKANLPFPAGHVLLYRTSLPGIVTCNMTNCTDIDGTNPADLTKATLFCRRQMNKIISFLRKFVPGFENCYLISSASIIGVRETRHFYGEATITKDDIFSARVFEDWAITKAYFNFDVHNLTGNGLDKTGVQKHFSQKNGYTIPYGCLVPKKIDNLLLAGRDICGTHIAHSNFRVMPICANMGQAAGVAASLCVKMNVLPRELNVKHLQKRLIDLGVTP